MSNFTKLSVVCITYNHEKFIRKALDGFVMQKTNFPFEVLIHDDASTDKTADIIREYEKKYPDIIKAIYQKENQFSTGINVSKHFIYPKIRGKYVALCEGDDYWTDENKLQKQVDFLDKHPDVSVCFHPVKVIWEDGSKPEHIFPTAHMRFNKDILTIDDLLKHNFIQTNSVVYRWRLKGQEYLFPDGILPRDYFLHLLHAQVGKIAFLPDVMAVYRRHQGGIWTGAGKSDAWFLRCAIPHIRFYFALEKQFQCDRSREIALMTTHSILIFTKNKRWDLLETLSQINPENYQKVLEILLQNQDNKQGKIYKKYKKIVCVLAVLLILSLLYLILK